MQEITVPISPGELIDKITILEIKSRRNSDVSKLANIRYELDLLVRIWNESPFSKIDIGEFWNALRKINADLWDIEDRLRILDREHCFGDEFIKLARAVYYTNDDRARVKREINLRLGSRMVEEKSYPEYAINTSPDSPRSANDSGCIK
jgi:hypothetical protein